MKTFAIEIKEFFGALWGTLKVLAQSRKVVLALAAAVLTLLVAVVPQLAPLQGKVTDVVDLFIGVVIAGIALEDAAAKSRSGGAGG